MSTSFKVAHEFVEFIPREMDERTLYISMEFATASHKCLCGCGAEVVTPISPVGWQMGYDGETVSLTPSIGSSSLPCRSHYFIRRGRVDWAPPMTDEGIAKARQRDARDVQRHYGTSASQAPVPIAPAPPVVEATTLPSKRGLFGRIMDILRGR